MGLDLKKMREQQARIHSAAGGGDDKKFLYAEKLKAEEYVKPMPDVVGSLNGSYFIEQVVWWINGKMYLSNATFNQDCVIQEEYEKAKKLAERDEDIAELLTKRNEKKAPLIQRQTRFLVPVLHLAMDFDGEVVEKVHIQDGIVKVFVMKPKLMDDFHRVITSKQVNKKGGWGAMDKEHGSIIQVGREGQGLDTTYYAGFFEKVEDDDVYEELTKDKYYTTEAIPDIWKMTKSMQKSDEYLRSVIRNYFYGEEIIEDDSKDRDEGSKTSKKKSRVEEDEDEDYDRPTKHKKVIEEDEDEEPTPPKKKRKPVDEEDEEEEYTPKKKATKKVVEEEEDEEDDEPAPPKKKPTKTRSVVDDIEDELNSLDD